MWALRFQFSKLSPGMQQYDGWQEGLSLLACAGHIISSTQCNCLFITTSSFISKCSQTLTFVRTRELLCLQSPSQALFLSVALSSPGLLFPFVIEVALWSSCFWC